MQIIPGVSIDFVFHGAELLALGGMSWKVIRAVNRFTDVFRDFPPHRHINGKIVYPDGYAPTKLEELKG